MQSGWTLCLSSQIGCRMGCRFCETGRLGLLRHLTTDEIVAQLACALHWFGKPIRNIVFMGMGEPMDNLEAVIPAIEIFSDEKGFAIGRRHITVSTSGHLEGLHAFTTRVRPHVNLAVSVIASNEDLRTRLMPVNRRWNMSQLYEAMKSYTIQTNREILVEYVLLKDLNDSPKHALELAHYLQGLKVKVNLIPYNRQSPSSKPATLQLGPDDFYPAEETACELFAKILREKGYRTLLRKRKGHEIMAACGQLGNQEWKNPEWKNQQREAKSESTGLKLLP
jgi:23S rRNA (adenine2503-C2)-methyltransferase